MVISVNEVMVQLEEIKNTVYDKVEEIDKLREELDVVRRERDDLVPALDENAELKKEVETFKKKWEQCTRNEYSERCYEMHALKGFHENRVLKGSLASAKTELSVMKTIESATEVEMKALKGSLASAQSELSEIKTLVSATEDGSLQRDLAEMRKEVNKLKRQYDNAIADRDRAMNADYESRRLLDEAHNKTKRQFFTKFQSKPAGSEALP